MRSQGGGVIPAMPPMAKMGANMSFAPIPPDTMWTLLKYDGLFGPEGPKRPLVKPRGGRKWRIWAMPPPPTPKGGGAATCILPPPLNPTWTLLRQDGLVGRPKGPKRPSCFKRALNQPEKIDEGPLSALEGSVKPIKGPI